MSQEASDQETGFNAFETNYIRTKAACLIRGRMVSRSDLDDVQQDLRLALLVAQEKVEINPDTRNAFARTVVNNVAATLITRRLAAKRNAAGVGSLQLLLAEVTELSELADKNSLSPEDQRRDLALDLEAVLATLPEELRNLAELLKTLSVTDAAKNRGVPRTSLYKPIEALRARLKRTGLDKYLPTTSDSFEAKSVIT